ncbi:hypothetical protein BC939DRAFT_310353 [Gamsiella multidivaricata]|uniref:uncharacterized protein n=1 Tax=Gamsiella multidivaricata TaxID=101098 RepID=UPI002220EC05|nr:uncharacterized protein BC939DRAFT_310353 [Gamsiella multidivaricata]KAI7817986.1 hypothetical protein BC939DRAFT_310353 [Gamsiella multidivaricata]
MGPLNALSALMEVNPLTSDRLLSSLPNVTDWNQFNQLNHFCSTLFEDVSGEAFEPQSYDTPLFPEYEQKPSTLALDAEFAGTIDLDSNMSAFSTAQVDSIYSTIIPDDSFVSSSTLAWNTSLSQPGPAVRHSQPVKHSMQQPNRFIHPQYVSLPALQQGAAPIKNESVEEIIKPTVVLQEKRTYVEVSIQTAEKMAADELRMLKQRPTVIRRKSRQLIDTDALLESVPEAPDTPMPDINVEETVAALEADIPETQEQDQSSSRSNEQSPGVTISSAPTSAPETNSSKYESYLQRAKARQAAVAAASAAATAAAMEPVDPVEAMSRQLAQTHIDGTDFKPILKPSTTKPIIEGDVERQIKAAKARSLCSQDPIRKQHAEVVLNLLRSIDTIMADHRKAAQAKSVANPRTGGGVHVQNQGQIRTVSSYLPRRGTSSTTFHRPSPLHHEQSADSPDYSKLRSSLAEGSSYSSPAVLTSSTAQSSDHTPSLKHGSEVSTDSPVLYPTSDLHHPSAVPFELSEEERRFIEEDNAKTAAAQAAAAGYRTARV